MPPNDPYDAFQHVMLADLASLLPELETWNDLREIVGSRMKYLIDFQYASLAIIDPEGSTYHIMPMAVPPDRSTAEDILGVPAEAGLIGEVLRERTPAVYDGSLLRTVAEAVQDHEVGDLKANMVEIVDPCMEGDGMESILCCPVRKREKVLGALTLGSQTRSFYSRQHVQLGVMIANMLVSCIELLMMKDQVRALGPK